MINKNLYFIVFPEIHKYYSFSDYSMFLHESLNFDEEFLLYDTIEQLEFDFD